MYKFFCYCISCLFFSNIVLSNKYEMFNCDWDIPVDFNKKREANWIKGHYLGFISFSKKSSADSIISDLDFIDERVYFTVENNRFIATLTVVNDKTLSVNVRPSSIIIESRHHVGTILIQGLNNYDINQITKKCFPEIIEKLQHYDIEWGGTTFIDPFKKK